MKKIFFLITIAFSSLSYGGSKSSGATKYFSLIGATGTINNKDLSVPKCTMMGAELGLGLGYMFGGFGLGLQANYRYLGQSTDPDKVSGTNVGGSGYTLGAGLLFDFSGFDMALIYDLSGSYTLSKESASGDKVSYGSPKGLHLNMGFGGKGTYKWIVSVSSLTYSESTSGGTKVDIKDNPLSQLIYGLGLQWDY